MGAPRERSGSLSAIIELTLFHGDATRSEVATLCETARRHRFASVAVHPIWVSACAEILAGTDVHVCALIAYPFGAARSFIKAREAAACRRLGAAEVDVVVNTGIVKSGDVSEIGVDLRAVRDGVGPSTIVKAILEAGLLDDDELRSACRLALEASADFVGVSTGFGPGGGTVHDVRRLRALAGDRARVKASRGACTFEEARALARAGADRLGTASGASIAEAERAGSPPGD